MYFTTRPSKRQGDRVREGEGVGGREVDTAKPLEAHKQAQIKRWH